MTTHYHPRTRVYSCRYHDGKAAHTVELTMNSRKDCYDKLKPFRVLSVVFVRWADTNGEG